MPRVQSCMAGACLREVPTVPTVPTLLVRGIVLRRLQSDRLEMLCRKARAYVGIACHGAAI